jgi:hypothetical protein
MYGRDNGASGSARGNIPGFMYDLWRATDFWREALKPELREKIKLYNQWETSDTQTKTRKLSKDKGNYIIYEKINKAFDDQTIPADFFQNVAGWLWFVKEDGYMVKLTRDAQNRWSIHLRSGLQLHPPRGFLEGLEKNTKLPSPMIGELVTSFYGCNVDDRTDPGSRTLLRNTQFKILEKVTKHRNDPLAWVGLRIKVFAFPNRDLSMQETYDTCKELMQETLHHHPHIGMCKAGVLTSTQDAINMFERVVQMGLEGIVIVDPSVKYGQSDLLDSDKYKIGQTFFKLKQKVVLTGRHFENTGRTKEVWKDGTPEKEHKFKTTVDGSVVYFNDRIGKDTGYSRIKYMEHAPRMYDNFPCQSGYRHMHFAQHDDMSVVVPATAVVTPDPIIQSMLGLGVEPMNKLFNPRVFSVHDIPRHSESVIVKETEKRQEEKVESAAPIAKEKEKRQEEKVEPAAPRAKLLKRQNAGVWGESNPGASNVNPYVIDD